MLELDEVRVAIPGGGSGPSTIKEVLLDYLTGTVGIVSLADNGGHTNKIRTIFDIGATGDVASQLAVHTRNNPFKRALFSFRNPGNHQRIGNDIVALARNLTGNMAEGIDYIVREILSPHFVGRVLPISNDDRVHLRVVMKNGDVFIGEEILDGIMASGNNTQIDHTEFVDKKGNPINPEPYRPALLSIEESDVLIIPPGSWEGSLKAVLEVSGVSQALRSNNGKLVCFTNAVDIKGRHASDYLMYLANMRGRKIDLAVINRPNFELPETYKREHHYFVEPDAGKCGEYANRVIVEPIAQEMSIDGKPTIRHNGARATLILLDHLIETGVLNPGNGNQKAIDALREKVFAAA